MLATFPFIGSNCLKALTPEETIQYYKAQTTNEGVNLEAALHSLDKVITKFECFIGLSEDTKKRYHECCHEEIPFSDDELDQIVQDLAFFYTTLEQNRA